MLKRSLKPLAAEIGDATLDFRKLRRSHSTFYAVLNVHSHIARMNMGHGSFGTTMKYYTGVPRTCRNGPLNLSESCFSETRKVLLGTLLPSNADELDVPERELEEIFLQIREFKERARQDSNLRPSDS